MKKPDYITCKNCTHTENTHSFNTRACLALNCKCVEFEQYKPSK